MSKEIFAQFRVGMDLHIDLFSNPSDLASESSNEPAVTFKKDAEFSLAQALQIPEFSEQAEALSDKFAEPVVKIVQGDMTTMDPFCSSSSKKGACFVAVAAAAVFVIDNGLCNV
jgi:hypothetical protein